MSRHVRRLWRRLGFPIVGTLAALMYLCVAVGVPFPIPGISKDVSQSFPCMHSQCGCRNAEQCWRSCCCHTLAERFEWARQNGVRPPVLAIEQAKNAGLDVTWLAGRNDKKPNVSVRPRCIASSKGAAHSCCTDRSTTAAIETKHSCCSGRHENPQVQRATDRVV